jgi:hypothetical protein
MLTDTMKTVQFECVNSIFILLKNKNVAFGNVLTRYEQHQVK